MGKKVTIVSMIIGIIFIIVGVIGLLIPIFPDVLFIIIGLGFLGYPLSRLIKIFKKKKSSR